MSDAELQCVVVEEPLELQQEPQAAKSPPASRTFAAACKAHLRCFVVSVLLIAVVLALLPVLLLQLIGMLVIERLMPQVLLHVYPTRLGIVHVWFMRFVRWLQLPEEGHSHSIRVDLYASEGADALEAAAEEAPKDSGPAAAARAAVDERPYSVHTVACLLDNYAYIIVDRSQGPPYSVAFVDPCEPAAVLRALEKVREVDYGGAELRPVAILTTHHHWDHMAGNRALRKLYPQIEVCGGADDRVSAVTRRLRDGATVRVGGLRVLALSAPCHTRGSLVYVLRGPTPVAFVGDTLFCGGCGAPFEGTQQEMSAAFAKIWRYCPPSTLVFSGHEYASAILPGYLAGQLPFPDTPKAFGQLCTTVWRTQMLRLQSPAVPTVPFLLADELVLNANFQPLRKAADHLAGAWRQHLALTAAPTLATRALRAHGVGPPPPALEPLRMPGAAAATAAAAAAVVAAATRTPATVEEVASCVEVLLEDTTAPALSPPPSPPAVEAPPAAAPAAEAPSSSSTLPPPHARAPVASAPGAFWRDGRVALVPVAELERLAQLLRAGDDGVASAASLVRRLQATAPPPPRVLRASVAHADPPATEAWRRSSTPAELVTQAETLAAFELLGGSGGRLSRALLRRLITSRWLAESPLSEMHADEMLAHVAPAGAAAVALDVFNTRLSVLPSLPEPAAPPRCACCRPKNFLASLRPRRRPRNYEEGDFSDDGTIERFVA